MLAVLAETTIARAHADHAVPVREDILAGKSGEEVDASAVDLIGQPANEGIQRNDVVAVIAQRRRDDRERQLRRSGQEVDAIVRDLGDERRAFLAKVGNQLAKRRGVEHGARQLCAPASRAFSSTAIDSGAPACCLQLREPNRRRQPGRPAADDQDVDVERLTLHGTTKITKVRRHERPNFIRRASYLRAFVSTS